MTSNDSSTLKGWSPSPSESSSPATPRRGFARNGNGFVASQNRAWQNESNQMFNQQQPRGPPQGPFGRQPYGPSGGPPRYRVQTQWQDWPELKILVKGVAPDVATLELWQLFHKEGNIDYMRISTEVGTDKRTGEAVITFKPPPRFDFWTDRMYPMESPQFGTVIVQVGIDPMASRYRMIPSPVNRGRRYPIVRTLLPKALGFGVSTAEDSMMIKKFTIAEPLGELLFCVDLGSRSIVVAFNDRQLREETHAPSQYTRYKFLVRFDQLKSMKRVPLDADSNHSALIISMDHPPQFFCQPASDVRSSHKDDSLTWSERDSWHRATNIGDTKLLADKVVSLSKTEEPVLDMGRWLTYMLVFENHILQSAMFEDLTNALKDWNIDINEVEKFERNPGEDVEVWKIIDRPVSNRNDEMHCLMEGGQFFNLPFEVRYQLEVCISQNILEEHSITETFLQRLADLALKERDLAQSILEFLAIRGKRVYDPMTIFDDREALAHSTRIKIPPYCAYARKAIITPTTINLNTPTVEISNRVIRNYADYEDRFISVQFTEEDTRRRVPQSAGKSTNDALYTRVFRTLKNGIRVGDRHYEFLAFGGSQFREHGAYFFAPTDDLSCADIRKWMGTFTNIRNPAKYAARLGQCFSTTRAMKNRKIIVSTIPDVERNGHCFTDGVGKVSSFIMKLIQEELRLPEEPSVVQFRMGGCKGVLAMSPELNAYEVQVRKSQVKFLSEYNGLEIIRASQFSFATVNRQTITILSALGVPDDVFLKKLDEQLANYEEAVTNPDKADELLRRYIDEQHSTMAIAAMVHNGFMRAGDPFVNSLLHLWRSWSIKYLKEKARLIVEKGAFVFGCADETQSLRGHTDKPPGPDGEAQRLEIDDLPQIFLQVTDPNDPSYTKIIEGVCLVGRNPSHHPGDIRVCQAVDIPALHHLKDVVVFSQLGDRDVPGMCSGGDLDGDDFFVIWDKDFIPKEWNTEPMEMPATPKNDLRRPVRMEDVMAHFVTYMKNDTLGQISNAHLAWSDHLPDSVKDPICIELAALASSAVDYVKSGVPVEMTKERHPNNWPHFMERRSDKGVYRSIKIVGQLFDRVVLVDFKPQYEMPFDPRVLNAYHDDKEILKKARQLKTQYDSAVLRIMAQYGIEAEFEVWTSFLMGKPTGFNEYQGERQIAQISDAIKEKFRTACIEAAGGSDFKNLAPFVAAMYKVTSEEMEFALKECKMFKTVGGLQVSKREMVPKSMPLISFPWLFPDKLGRIATNSEPYDLLGLEESKQQKKRRPKKTAAGGVVEEEPEDIIQTADGVVHRGELLDLFNEVEYSDDEQEKDEPMPESNPVLLDTLGIDVHDEDVSPFGTRAPSPVKDQENTAQESSDVRRPSLIDVGENKHDDTIQLVETAEKPSRKSSVASSAMDDLDEMKQFSATLNGLAGLEEPLTEEDWNKLVVAAKGRTPKKAKKSAEAELMSMDDFDKLPVVEAKPALEERKWVSTTSDSEDLFNLINQAHPPRPLQPSQSGIGSRPLSPPSSSPAASASKTLKPAAQASDEQDLLELPLPLEPEQPSTPVLAPVMSSKVILEDMDSLPSPEKVIPKQKSAPKIKPATADTESKKTPFFAPKPNAGTPVKQNENSSPKKSPTLVAIRMSPRPRSLKLVENKTPAVVETAVEEEDSRFDDSILADHFEDEPLARSGGTVEMGAQDKLMMMVGDLDTDQRARTKS